MLYTIVHLQKDPESCWGVTIPGLAGCFSAGDTIEGAIKNASEAIHAHLEILLADPQVIIDLDTTNVMSKLDRNVDGIFVVVPFILPNTNQNNITCRFNISGRLTDLETIDNHVTKNHVSRSGFMIAASLEKINLESK